MSEKKNSSAKSALDDNNLENVSGGTVDLVPEHYEVKSSIHNGSYEEGTSRVYRLAHPRRVVGRVTGSFTSKENAGKANDAINKLDNMKF